MDANELATIAFDAMPLDVLAPADKGQVWGVLQMALRTLETELVALICEANEETSTAMQLITEMQNQLEAMRQERDALHTKIERLDTDNKLMWADLMGLARESSKYVNDEVSVRTATEAALTVFEMYEVAAKDREELRQERDDLAVAMKLLKHPNMFERGEQVSAQHAQGVPVTGAMGLRTLEAQHGALLTEADEETAEAKKLWREALAELESAKAEVAAMTAERDNALRSNSALNVELRNREAELRNRDANLNASCKERDELLSMVAARDETITGLQAENARLHRSLEERMTAQIPGLLQLEKLEDLGKVEKLHNLSAQIPGAVKVANTEELHGMADVYAQSQRMQAEEAPPINVYPPGTKVARGKT